MPKQVTFIIPSSEEREDWMANIPELNLLGNFVVQTLPWDEYQTGSDQDWAGIAHKLHDNWAESEGFVIWAPEQSILGLAGYLSMVFDHPGKPIVLFSAPAIDQLSDEVFEKLELKSVCINAMYLAQSEIAEVLILSGQHIYRPAGCYWSTENNRPVIQSIAEPLAHLDYKLIVHKAFAQRHPKTLLVQIPEHLSQNLSVTHWLPGLDQEVVPSDNSKAFIVQLDAHNWRHPQLQKLRRELQSKQLPTIWYSQQEWGKEDFSESELAITHPQFWWVLLAMQVSFGIDSQNEQAMERLQRYVKRNL